ncbi:MAG: thioredoxin family protein [Candidatus Bathyarchaeota archaeon]|nr:MAG: thioredoxin family protein [Candidatus Bathyarchaeota archaeon]
MVQTFELEKLREKAEPVSRYLDSVSGTSSAFARRREEYSPDEGVLSELKEHASRAVIIVFSAEWCPDCFRNVPVLDVIREATGIEVLVFGHLMRDVKDPKSRWHIPPSPEEVKEFDVVRIPLITVLNNEGEKIGEIVENPPEGKTLETALLDILRTS